jgi:hypothetical protein
MSDPYDVVRAMKMKILDASSDGDVDELRRLIHGSSVAARSIFDDAILAACENGHTEVVRLLLEYGADPGYMAHFRTLLGEGIRKGHADLVRLLIDDYGVAVDDGVAEPMIVAISDSGSFQGWASGQLEVVRILLARGASPNTTKKSGFEAGASALWLAVHGDRIEIARALIEAGAEVDFKGPRGVTPLWKAVYNGRLAMARLLLDCSSSSIDWACDRHVNSPRVQVPSTVDGGTVSLGGSTPLSLACLTGKVGLARLLLQRGARPATALSWPTVRADGKYVEPVLDMLRQYYAVHVTLDVLGRRERRRDIVPRIISFLVPPRV